MKKGTLASLEAVLKEGHRYSGNCMLLGFVNFYRLTPRH